MITVNARRARRATEASTITVQRMLKSQPTSERIESQSSLPQPPSGEMGPVPGLLIVVSCGKRKIWDVDPWAATRSKAGNAYVGAYFDKNRAYARRFGESWCILSAKFGLMLPDEDIENYDVTFKHHSPELVTVPRLKEQAAAKGLDRFRVVQVLGGKEYVDRVRLAFGGFRATVESPLSGLGNR